MTLTAAQAINLLDTIHTEEELRSLIRRFDTTTHGTTTVVYTGPLNAAHTMEYISEFKKHPDLRVLDNTEAGKFLDLSEEAL